MIQEWQFVGLSTKRTVVGVHIECGDTTNGRADGGHIVLRTRHLFSWNCILFTGDTRSFFGSKNWLRALLCLRRRRRNLVLDNVQDGQDEAPKDQGRRLRLGQGGKDGHGQRDLETGLDVHPIHLVQNGRGHVGVVDGA